MKFLSSFIVFSFLFVVTQTKPTTGDYVGIYIPVLYKKALHNQAENTFNSELVKHKNHLVYGIGIIQSTFIELGLQHNYVRDEESEYQKYLNQFDISIKYFGSELEKYDTYGLGLNFSVIQTNDMVKQIKNTAYVIAVEANYSFLIPFSESEDHYLQVRLIYPLSTLNNNEYTEAYKKQNIRIALVYRYHF